MCPRPSLGWFTWPGGQRHRGWWQGLRHARAKLGPPGPPPLAPEATSGWPALHPRPAEVAPRPWETVAAAGPSQPAPDSQGPGSMGPCIGNRATFLHPWLPPLLGTHCGLYPSLDQSSKLGGGFPVGKLGSWRLSCPVGSRGFSDECALPWLLGLGEASGLV